MKVTSIITVEQTGVGKPDYKKEVWSTQLPFDPEMLNRALQARMLTGQTWFPMVRLAWNCPAGLTIFPITMPTNFYCTRRDCRLSSDFYDPNIIVQVFVDDQLTTPYGIALTGPSEVDFGEYYIKRREVRIETTNNTITPAMLSLEEAVSFIEKSFYDSFYSPLIHYMYKALQEVANAGV